VLLVMADVRKPRPWPEGAVTWEPARGLEPLTFCLQETGRPKITTRTAGRPVCAWSPMPAVVSLCCGTSVLYFSPPKGALATRATVPEGAPARTARRCDRQLRAGVPSGPRGLGVARPPLRARPTRHGCRHLTLRLGRAALSSMAVHRWGSGYFVGGLSYGVIS
jgi:hypothetical protein